MKKIIEGKISDKKIKVRLRMHKNKRPEFMVEGRLMRRSPNIKECKNYYRFDKTQEIFDYHICLGASPTSNKESVKKYWESQGKSIEIEDRNPLLLWEMDYYGKDFEEVMLDECGPNWKEYWDNEWKKIS